MAYKKRRFTIDNGEAVYHCMSRIVGGQHLLGDAEKEKLKDVNRQKSEYEQNIAKLKNKLDVIGQIQEGRYLPVRLFDELTKVLDKDTPVWLTSFSVDEGKIKMEGMSLSNKDLADFVTRLERTPFYKDVDLLYSEKQKKDDREIYKFSLNAMAQTENAADGGAN